MPLRPARSKVRVSARRPLSYGLAVLKVVDVGLIGYRGEAEGANSCSSFGRLEPSAEEPWAPYSFGALLA
jgi:hypothetical protein